MLTSSQLDYPIKVINLERNIDRLAIMEKWYNDIDTPFDRYPATLGSSLQNPARYFLLRAGRDVHDGTLGCALSHFGVWIEVAAGGDEHVLVLEDDAKPFGTFPRRFADLNIPKDYDVCYVNERMVPRRDRARPQGRRFLPLAEALLTRATGQRGHGADGYFVSKKGAEKLVKAFHRDRLLGHVDLQMLAIGLTMADLDMLVSARDDYGLVKRITKRRVTRHNCKMFVMAPSLVAQHDDGVSVRTGKNRTKQPPSNAI